MSGFFSLGGSTFAITKDHQEEENDPHNNNQEQQDSIITPNSLYLFKNEEIYNKGFDLWQQYYQLHRHHHQQNPTQHYDHHSSKRTTSSTSCGVEDLCLNNSNNSSSNCDTNNNLYTSWKVMRASSGYGIGSSGEHSGSASGGVNCQDCGNQAKKDCQHMRCRTCCKSRGFQCQTHVKSTWVPAAKRRERQQQLQSLTTQNQQQHNMAASQHLSLMMRGSASGAGGAGDGDGIDQNPKRLREDHHQLMITSATTGGGGGGGVVALNLPVAHHHNTLGYEVGHFPAEVSSPAVFRCVRVSAMAEAEEQLAYQTAVNIGGHVFKGILYDHGPEGGGRAHQQQQQQQQHNLIAAGTMGMANAVTVAHPNVTGSIDPSIYPTPLNAFMAGTQFFPPPR